MPKHFKIRFLKHIFLLPCCLLCPSLPVIPCPLIHQQPACTLSFPKPYTFRVQSGDLVPANVILVSFELNVFFKRSSRTLCCYSFHAANCWPKYCGYFLNHTNLGLSYNRVAVQLVACLAHRGVFYSYWLCLCQSQGQVVSVGGAKAGAKD